MSRTVGAVLARLDPVHVRRLRAHLLVVRFVWHVCVRPDHVRQHRLHLLGDNLEARIHSPISPLLMRPPRSRRVRRIVPRVLNAAALLQWAASAYVLSVYWGELGSRGSTLQVYDCVVSELESAPGSSPCSVEDFCFKTALFRVGQFEYVDSFEASGRYNLRAYFFIWTGMALLLFVFLLISWCQSMCSRSSAKARQEDAGYIWRVFNRGPHFYLAFATFITLITIVGYAIHVLKTWDSPRNREGPFVFHEE